MKMFHKIILAVLVPAVFLQLEAHPQTYDARLAVILPFTAKSAEGTKSLEFYRGMLLAANDMKQQGYNVFIAAYDEHDSSTDITPVLDTAFKNVDIVIGCLYRDHVITASRTAANLGKKALFPFATYIPQETIDCPAAIYTIPTPSLFTQRYAEMLQSVLGKSNTIYIQAPHPQTATETEDLLLILRKKGCKLTTVTDSDVSTIASLLTSRRHNLIVTDTNDLDFAKHLLETIDTANAADNYEVSVAGTSGWSSIADALPQPSHHSLLIPTTWYPNSSSMIIDIKNAYTQWFHTTPSDLKPSPYLMGYELGLYAITQLKANPTSFPMGSGEFTQGLNNYHFVTSFSAGCYTNASLRILRSAADGTISLIQQQ